MRVNKFNSLSYFILTVTLLLGVFFRIYNLTIFKATIPFFIIVTGSYLFISGDKKNYFKLGLLVILLGKEANQYTYILLTVLLFNTKIFIPFRKPAKYLYLLLMVGFFSYLVNQVIEINLLAFPAFVGSFFLPASLFMVTYRYVDEEMKDDLIQYYMVLITILAVVAIIQFGTLGVTVDRLTGGTTSSHTLGFHMAVGFLLLFGKLFVRKTIKKFKPHEILLFTLIFPVMFLSDAKYLMGNMIIGSFSIFLFLYIRKWLRPIVIISVAVGAFLGINYIQNKYIQLSVKSEVDVSYVSIRFIDSAKLQLYLKTLYLPINEPTVFLIGSGPGTFLSRAANSRASDTMDKSVTIGEGQSTQVDSKLPAFIPPFTSWITSKYAVKYFGSRWYGTLFDFRSSVISFIWEFGLVGLTIFFLFFKDIFKRMSRIKVFSKKLESDAFFLQSFIVFYILNSLLAYYFEYPETQILFWMFLGSFLRHEFDDKK